ncbi:MAG: restriction endonuclease subunit R [Flavobacteriales bacterium CG_4_9_14_3_um_filter_40_17]|nr:MAG: restriction endonuclease subunit R [Flavobacteriales bacterium CG_4_9_14_3_um_filter_40_17]
MQMLNFPTYAFRYKTKENKRWVFDGIRKKFVVLTPEEWVRQNAVQFLMREKKYPQSLVNVEKQIRLGDLAKRYDLVVFNPDGTLFLLGECKATSIPLTQDVFDQLARYNQALNAEFLWITNGLRHLCFQVDKVSEKYILIPEIPEYIR